MAKRQEKSNEQRTQAMEPARSGPESSPATTRLYDADEIARRAYQRFLERGGEHGHDMDDWYEAERELQSRRVDGTATPPHGDELAAAIPEQQSIAPGPATPRAKGRARAKKDPAPQRPDRAADQH